MIKIYRELLKMVKKKKIMKMVKRYKEVIYKRVKFK